MLQAFVAAICHTNLLVNTCGKKIIVHSVNHINLQKVSCPKIKKLYKYKDTYCEGKSTCKNEFFAPKLKMKLIYLSSQMQTDFGLRMNFMLKIRNKVQRDRKVWKILFKQVSKSSRNPSRNHFEKWKKRKKFSVENSMKKNLWKLIWQVWQCSRN